MEYSEIHRLSRLTAILIQFQTRRIVTALELAQKFNVSKRTIYRDIKALEQAGVPILTEEGKGYSLLEGYKVPPVMFTENQANALILAEQLVLQNNDASFAKDYSEAIDKVKAILGYSIKDKTNLLAERTQYREVLNQQHKSDHLSDVQNALTNYKLIQIEYVNKEGTASSRLIEPFAIVNSANWYLIAWCRLRKQFRFFRVDRINSLQVLTESFEPHNMTLQEYFDQYH